MRPVLYILVAALLLGAVSLPLSAAPVSGVVVDRETGEPLPHAHITVIDRPEHFVASSEGVFRMDLPPDSYLFQVDMIGYESTIAGVEVAPSGVEGLRISLMPRPIELHDMRVTADRQRDRFDELRRSVSVLTGDELRRDYAMTLAATLRNRPGVSVRSMGPAPARPVVRGLGGDRVVVSQDGVATSDLSATSPDHAVTVDPYSAQSVELVRGPRVLLHTSTPSGGLVNIERNLVPRRLPNGLVGLAGAYGESANRGGQASASLTAPLGTYALRSDLSYRVSGDERTPAGVLGNTGTETLSFASGVSRINMRSWFGGSFEVFDSDYGIPGGFIGAHPNGVDIEMLRRTFGVRGGVIFGGFVESVEAQAQRTYYRHREYESHGTIGAEFVVRQSSGSATVHLNTAGQGDNTILTLGVNRRDLKMGGFVFTPPTVNTAVHAALFHAVPIGAFDVQAAARYDYAHFSPNLHTYSASRDDLRDRDFHTWAGSLAALYAVTGRITTGLTVSRSSRIPTVEELYNEGPHLAAYTYEVGNPGLPSECGIGVEWENRYASERLEATVSLFASDFSSFVTPRNTGEINYAQLLPIYAAQAVSARFAGAEASVELHVWRGLHAGARISGVRAENRTDGVPLPEIPPVKATWDVRWEFTRATVGVTGEHAVRQGRVDTYELPTAGYSVFGAYVQTERYVTGQRHAVSLSLDNLFNAEYRNHLSRVRSIMPETGRNVRLDYRVYVF